MPPPRSAACGEPQSIRAEHVWTGRRSPLTSAPTSSAKGCAAGTRGGNSEWGEGRGAELGLLPQATAGKGGPCAKGGASSLLLSVLALMPSFSREICHQQQLHLI